MRKLSDYQKTPWMQKISKLPHKWPDRRGENNPRCRLTNTDIALIRHFRGKIKAYPIAIWYEISERYVYQLWAGERRK